MLRRLSTSLLAIAILAVLDMIAPA